MLHSPLVLHAPHLPAPDRLQAATTIGRHAADKAVELALEVGRLASRIDALGASLHGPGDVLATLRGDRCS